MKEVLNELLTHFLVHSTEMGRILLVERWRSREETPYMVALSFIIPKGGLLFPRIPAERLQARPKVESFSRVDFRSNGSSEVFVRNDAVPVKIEHRIDVFELPLSQL